MAQGRKIDAEAKAKVVLAKLIDPQNKSTRDIAEDTWLWKSTVADILKESSEVLDTLDTSGKAKELFDYNLEIINEWAKKVAIAMKTMTPKEIKEAKDMQSIIDTAFKQNQLIGGKATSIVKLDVSEMSEKELDEYRRDVLGL